MKMLILTLLSLAAGGAFAGPPSVEAKCYQAMDHSAKTGKPTVVMANSNAAWNVLLEDVIKKARLECKEGPAFGDCLGEFLDNLQTCDRAGDKKLQDYIEDLRQAAEAHATHSGKTVQMSVEDKGAKK